MELLSQPVTAPRVDRTDTCGVEWGVLGYVASASGVQILATHGVPNGKTMNEVTTIKPALSYLLHAPRDAAICHRGRSFRPEGHLNFYSPGTSFKLRSAGPMTMSMCIFSPRFLTGLTEAEGGFNLGHLDLLSDIQSERLVYLGRAMFREATQPGFASSLFAEAVGIEIALEIARYNGARSKDSETSRCELGQERMRRLESYVRDHPSEKLSLKELALQLGTSVRQLSRAVRQTKGTSIHHWIAECRFAEAHRLLAETDLSIQAIALRCAFQSSGAFSTAFLAVSGVSPSRFRQLISGSSHLPRRGASGFREPPPGVP